MIVLSYIAAYLAVVNIAGFLCMAVDKHKARRNKWRIPEATLFLFAVSGGSLGCLLGMRLFHHKTKKPLFRYGMLFLMVVWTTVLANMIHSGSW